MKIGVRVRFLAVQAALVAFCAFAQDKLPESEASAVRAVVEAQLDAFRKDDAERAFSYASEDIRAVFGTPGNFMAMVRRSYPAVYRPRSVDFEPAVMFQGIVLQAVRLTDAEGRAWLALYPMQRLPDGSWRIDGCQLARVSGQET